MAKYLNRLNARIARAALAESAKESKNWIVSRKLILETEEGNMEFDKGDTVEIGATPEGDMAMKGQAAVVVVSDADLASKIADVVVNADELTDVNFVEKPALDAMLDGENVEDVVDSLADAPMDLDGEDDLGTDIEVAEVDIEQKESVEAKFEKFSGNRMNPAKFLVCESILIDEADNAPINLKTIKKASVLVESTDEYASFANRVSELKGSLQPGEREVALSESGKVIGSFVKADNKGELFLENEFDSVEEMDSFEDTPESVVDGGEEFGDVDGALGDFEESAKTGEDYVKMEEALAAAGLEESTVAKIVATFENRSLKEGVKVFDTKYGKNVMSFKEGVDADNFIAETGKNARFTKRFFV